MISILNRIRAAWECIRYGYSSIYDDNKHRYTVRINEKTFYADAVRVAPSGLIEWLYCSEVGNVYHRMDGSNGITDYQPTITLEEFLHMEGAF